MRLCLILIAFYVVTGGFPLRSMNIFVASAGGSVGEVEEFLNSGIGTDSFNSHYGTPLMAAIANGHLNVVKLLAERGANIRESLAFGMTPLMMASRMGYANIVSYLLQSGSEVDATGHTGETALWHAAHFGCLECIQELISSGANVNHRLFGGDTPLMCAASEGRLSAVKLLFENGADHFVASSYVNSNGQRIHWAHSALLAATFFFHVDVVRYLVENGAVVEDKELPVRLGPKDLNDEDVQMRVQVLARLLILGGINPASIMSFDLLNYALSLTKPLHAIELAIRSDNPLQVYVFATEDSLLAYGLSPIQGFLAFSFALYTRGQRVLVGGSEYYQRMMDLSSWDSEVIRLVDAILYHLSNVGCTMMNFTFTVAPWLEEEGSVSLERLHSALSLFGSENGHILNHMIQRSSPIGFGPVVNAAFEVHQELTQDLRTMGYPMDIILKIISFFDLNDRLMSHLKIAIDRHYQE
jgi:hypothetical protein